VIYFRVGDIHATQESLARKGVPFEAAPHIIHKHEDGTEEWMTFFRDPDGNMLSRPPIRRVVHERPYTSAVASSPSPRLLAVPLIRVELPLLPPQWEKGTEGRVRALANNRSISQLCTRSAC